MNMHLENERKITLRIIFTSIHDTKTNFLNSVKRTFFLKRNRD